MKAKNTRLCEVQRFDVGMIRVDPSKPLHVAIGLFEGDEGDRNKYDYAHAFYVRDLIDPETEVIEARPNFFLPKEIVCWHDEFGRLRSNVGVKVHAVYPQGVIEAPIDWNEYGLEIWRIRKMNNAIAHRLGLMLDDEIGKAKYDIVQLLTNGALRTPGSYVCSHLVASKAYYASIGEIDEPIVMTPSADGMRDRILSPNDLINSQEMYRPTWNGLIE